MSTVTVNGLLAARAADVWRLLADLPARPGRFTGTSAVEVLTPGPFAPGTAWRETRSRPDGTALVEEFVVLVAEPSRRLVLASPGVGADYRIDWTLREVRRREGRRTAVRLTQEAVPTAPFGRAVALLLGGLAARAVEGALRRDLADLAAVLGAPTREAA
ncbi:Polyketide cyclase / dehydrase and lipid transport [Micromonospora nigra]|uniref:Polyketide cyclase / dehydrase and lipid transport n=1 Tax=Micromonospora nigra TaxID=145857 RepID=A0A1C6RUW5_9ACTN|nr:SRPBCC family protein [Micromonospora nigra]SCL20872.1 Polyketide cyclase / dehydrase and lipid transport [Micromonospora nigra]